MAKRSSIFPQEQLMLTSLATNLSLFGIADTTHGNTPSDTTASVDTNISPHSHDNYSSLHLFPQAQLSRLVSLKYNGDPYLLIRQLSLELCKKDDELDVLSRDKFSREQRLIRLCNVYGNLSTMEIDRKLLENQKSDHRGLPGPGEITVPDVQDSKSRTNLQAENSPLRTRLPSLVGSSSKSSLFTAKPSATGPSSSINPSPNSTGPTSSIGPTRSGTSSSTNPSPNSAKPSQTTSYVSGSLTKLSPTDSSIKLLSLKLPEGPPRIRTSRTSSNESFLSMKPRERLATHPKDVYQKLRSWFNSQDDLLQVDNVSEQPSVAKAPVELDNFGDDNSECLADEIELPNEVHVDKYGFITDLQALRKLKGHEQTSVDKNTQNLHNDSSIDSKHQESSNRPLHSQYVVLNTNQKSPAMTLALSPTFPIVDRCLIQLEIEHDDEHDIEESAILIGNKSRSETIRHLKQISEKHDSVNLKYEQEWDTLLNNIKRDFLKNNTNLTHNAEIVGVRGLNLLTLDAHERTNYHAKFAKLVNKVGIPSKYRLGLWLELSGGGNLRVHGEYRQLLNEAEACKEKEADELDSDARSREIAKNVHQIDLDLHRTLPLNFHFNNVLSFKPGPNFYKLQRVLYAFVAYRPDIGYFQGMNKIVGNLLLLLSKNGEDEDKFKEEDVFWIFVGLTEEILPKYSNNEKMYFNALMDIKLDQVVLHEYYLKKHLPRLYEHFLQLGLEVEIITMNWWLTLFIDLQFMDLETWFKLFENLLVDSRVSLESETPDDHVDQTCMSAIKLMSLSLSIFKTLELHLLSITLADDIYLFLASSNKSNSNTGEGQRTLVKFIEMLRYHRYFMNAISVSNYEKHRLEISKRK